MAGEPYAHYIVGECTHLVGDYPRRVTMVTPSTSEEELAAWTRVNVESDSITGGGGGAGSGPESSKAEEKAPLSRTALIQLVLVGTSLSLGLLALFISIALYVPPVYEFLSTRYRTMYGVYGAILATLLLFLAITYPRVQASVPLSVTFGTLFVIAFSYFCAIISAIVNSAAGLIIAVVPFLGCWELLVLSLFGVELEDAIIGKVATYVAYTVNYAVIVALRPSSRMPITDAVIAAIVILSVAWFFLIEVCQIVDKIQEDSQN